MLHARTVSPTEVIVLLAALGMLIAVGVYLVSRFRGTKEQGRLPPSELLSKFRQMHSQGELSDEEYRTIKAMLAERFQQELKGTDQQR